MFIQNCTERQQKICTIHNSKFDFCRIHMQNKEGEYPSYREQQYWPKGFKTISKCNSAEHGICPAYRFWNTISLIVLEKKKSCSAKLRMKIVSLTPRPELLE